MSLSGHCVHCGRIINPQRDYQQVTGWQRKALAASRRSGSDIFLREPVVDRWACWSCIDRLKRGLAVGQGSLV